jgi:polyisoprenoid-binding protein YceI
MKTAVIFMVGAFALSSFACDNNPAKGKTQAAVSEPSPAAPAANPSTGVSYAFSQANSSIEYVGAKVTGKHEGKLGTFSGNIQLVDGDPTKSAVSVDIDVGSITSDNEKLTRHLKSADFFDVEKFPKATFKSTAIKAGGADGATHTITGNLDLRGVTKQIAFPATIKVGEGVQVNAEFAINRKDFGINYAGMANDLIKDEVLLKLKLDAKKSST